MANHLADVHELSSQERQHYLIRVKPTALDLENVLTELYRLGGDFLQSRVIFSKSAQNLATRPSRKNAAPPSWF